MGKRDYTPGPNSIYTKSMLVRLTPDQHEQLKQMAIDNDRTMAMEVRRAINVALNTHYGTRD